MRLMMETATTESEVRVQPSKRSVKKRKLAPMVPLPPPVEVHSKRSKIVKQQPIKLKMNVKHKVVESSEDDDDDDDDDEEESAVEETKPRTTVAAAADSSDSETPEPKKVSKRSKKKQEESKHTISSLTQFAKSITLKNSINTRSKHLGVKIQHHLLQFDKISAGLYKTACNIHDELTRNRLIRIIAIVSSCIERPSLLNVEESEAVESETLYRAIDEAQFESGTYTQPISYGVFNALCAELFLMLMQTLEKPMNDDVFQECVTLHGANIGLEPMLSTISVLSNTTPRKNQVTVHSGLSLFGSVMLLVTAKRFKDYMMFLPHSNSNITKSLSTVLENVEGRTVNLRISQTQNTAQNRNPPASAQQMECLVFGSVRDILVDPNEQIQIKVWNNMTYFADKLGVDEKNIVMSVLHNKD